MTVCRVQQAIKAVRRGRQSIGTHLSLPMDPAERDTYLLDAVVRGHYRQVKFFLEAGYDVNYVDIERDGKYELRHSRFTNTDRNTSSCTDLCGCDPFFINITQHFSSYMLFVGSTPLVLAVTEVKDNAVRNRLIVLLLQGGANTNRGDKYGLTPLMHSILRRQKDSVRLLLESVGGGERNRFFSPPFFLSTSNHLLCCVYNNNRSTSTLLPRTWKETLP